MSARNVRVLWVLFYTSCGTVCWFPHFGPEWLGQLRSGWISPCQARHVFAFLKTNLFYQLDLQRLARAGFLNAARIILRNWKNTNTPCYKDWIELMMVTASYELMLAKLKDSVSKFTEMWGSFLRFISGGDY